MVDDKTSVHSRWTWAWALIAWVGVSAGLAAAQSYTLWGSTWWWPSFYWPNFFAFLLPVIALGAVIAVVGRWLAPGQEGAWVRRWVWIALAVRLVSVVFWPIALREWGYRSPEELGGFLSTDAYNATNTAWTLSQESIPAILTFRPGHGDNTGGLTFLGVLFFRLFSPDYERPLLLGLVASAFSALTVLFVFLLGESLFSTSVARTAAVVAALFPEAVVIGSSDLEEGYLALFLAVMIWGLTGVFLGQRGEARGQPSHTLDWRSGLAFAAAGFLLSTGISTQFVLLNVAMIAIFALWLSDPRKTLGKIVWIGCGAVAFVLVVSAFLSQYHFFPYQFSLLLRQGRFLFGEAWLEYDKLRANASSSDLFYQLLSRLPQTLGLYVAGAWGLLQPLLPAAIGYRSKSPTGGGIAQFLGILRSAGWYLLLPFLAYGFVVSLRGFARRRYEAVFSIVFWVVALIASFRALGDQWDNPRYRLYALAPMALTAAWAYWHWRESRSPWLNRIQIPFWVAVAAMTAWYFGRYWLDWKLPVVAVLTGIVVLTLLAFLATVLAGRLVRRRRLEPPAASS
ncbi:MAG: hypothetical protein ABSG98_07090 [Anaerolineales bacterium]